MNRSLLSRIMPFLLAFYALSLAAFFVYAVVTFSATSNLPALRWEYALKRAFVLFMDYLFPIHAAAVAVAASLSFESGAARPGASRPAVQQDRLLHAGRVPRSHRRVHRAGRRRGSGDEEAPGGHAVPEQGRRRVQAAGRRGNAGRGLSRRQDAIDRYLEVDPGNRQMAAQRLDAVAKAARKSAPARGHEGGRPDRPRTRQTRRPSWRRRASTPRRRTGSPRTTTRRRRSHWTRDGWMRCGSPPRRATSWPALTRSEKDAKTAAALPAQKGCPGEAGKRRCAGRLLRVPRHVGARIPKRP